MTAKPVKRGGESLTLTLTLSPEQLDQIAERVAAMLAPSSGESDWLDVDGAARQLGYSDPDRGRARVYDLKSRGVLEHAHDGRRLLVKRASIDRYFADGVASGQGIALTDAFAFAARAAAGSDMTDAQELRDLLEAILEEA